MITDFHEGEVYVIKKSLLFFLSVVYGGRAELERQGETCVPVFLLSANVLERRVAADKVKGKPKLEGLQLSAGDSGRNHLTNWRQPVAPTWRQPC